MYNLRACLGKMDMGIRWCRVGESEAIAPTQCHNDKSEVDMGGDRVCKALLCEQAGMRIYESWWKRVVVRELGMRNVDGGLWREF